MSLPQQINMTQVLPPAVKALAKTISISPNNGAVFRSTTNNVIRIPISSEGFLNASESYLKFTITNTSTVDAPTANMHLDGSASAVINRLRVVCGSTVIHDINNYNVLAGLLIQTQGSDDFMRYMSVVSGTPNYNMTAGITAEAIVPSSQNILSVGAANAGVSAITQTDANKATMALETLAVRGNSVIPFGENRTYAIPIIAGILQCDKYLPLYLMANPLTLEIYLESNSAVAFKNPVAGAVLTPYDVSNVAYMANIINIMDEKVDAMMRGMLNSTGLILNFDDWNTTMNNVNAGQRQISTVIADRSQNLKAFISCFTVPATAVNSGLNTYRLDTSSYQYKIGNNYLPVAPVQVSATNLTDAFLEASKCFNQSIFSLGVRTFADQQSFGNNTTYTNTGCFCMAIDTEAFQNASESGINTSATQANILLNITTAQNTVASTLYTFSHRSAVAVLRPDGTVLMSV